MFKELYPDHRFGNIIIHWVNDDELLEMNKRFLNHNYYTDIITFDYSRGKKISGELYISKDRVIENAKKEIVPFDLERDRVIAHGVLHLLGFNDNTEKEQNEMSQPEFTKRFSRIPFTVYSNKLVLITVGILSD